GGEGIARGEAGSAAHAPWRAGPRSAWDPTTTGRQTPGHVGRAGGAWSWPRASIRGAGHDRRSGRPPDRRAPAPTPAPARRAPANRDRPIRRRRSAAKSRTARTTPSAARRQPCRAERPARRSPAAVLLPLLLDA